MPLRAAVIETCSKVALDVALTALTVKNNDDGAPGNPFMIQVITGSSHGK